MRNLNFENALLDLEVEAERLASVMAAIEGAMEYSPHNETCYTPAITLVSSLMRKHMLKIKLLSEQEVSA